MSFFVYILYIVLGLFNTTRNNWMLALIYKDAYAYACVRMLTSIFRSLACLLLKSFILKGLSSVQPD
jgi:hypothetical protein